MRLLKPGGSLILWHVPRWAMMLGSEAMGVGLTFRSWVAVDFNTGKTLPDRFTARHYALLWLTKGKPSTFKTIRVCVQKCRRCDATVKDYGGKLHELHPDGLRLSEIWLDIHPVKHRSRKTREANELPPKLVDRCLEVASHPGDVVLDPFGGSGTTYDVCERMGRRWIGIEIESVEAIVKRLSRTSAEKTRRFAKEGGTFSGDTCGSDRSLPYAGAAATSHSVFIRQQDHRRAPIPLGDDPDAG